MADYPYFLGGAYTSQSPLADCEQTINWYPERVEASGARNILALYPTPGFQSYLTTSDLSGRASFTSASRTHFVMGAGVYEVFSMASATRRGTVTQDSNPAQITYNGRTGNQLGICSGGNVYYLDLASNNLSQISGVTATQLSMIDGYFVSFDPVTSRIRVSPVNDTTGTWDPTAFSGRTAQPDPWKAMVIIPPNIYLLGELTGDVWYDSGATFPLAPRTGITFPYGIIAPFSACAVGTSVMWLGRDANGAGVVIQTQGYQALPVSSKALEKVLSDYQRTSTITDAQAFSYQQEGHLFYVLQFPTANATWVYDVTLALAGAPSALCWHKRGYWNPTNNSYDAWNPRVHTYAFNRHLTADVSSGTIAVMDVTYGSEVDGTAIRRVRVPPPLYVGNRSNRLRVSRFEPIFEPGLGLSSGQGSSPKVMLRISYNTKTWSNQRSATAGAQGQYSTRTYWLRNGSSTLVWVPEIVVSDPIPWRLIGAEYDGTGVRGQQQKAS